MSLKVGGLDKRKKREVNAELNLTSFIDLLSTCVCFLLITAVWVQVGSMEIKQSHGTEASAAKKESLDLSFKFIDTNSAELELKGNRFKKTLKVVKTEEQNFKEVLKLEMNKWMNNLSKKKELVIESAMVHPKSGVNYGLMVDALDVLRNMNITNIGIVPTKGKL